MSESQESNSHSLLKRVHNDERGSISLETILIIGAIAIPILIFLIKFGWPRIKDYFNKGMDELQEGGDSAGSNRL
jgi:F0F1-type ATP synthase membrane subunit b/b'